jgi:phospholipase C
MFKARLCFAVLVGFVFAGSANASGPAQTTSGAPSATARNVSHGQDVSVLNHIIFLVQENHSLDDYFGELRQYWADNGYPDQSFDGLPQFNPTTGIPPLYGPPPSNPGCNPNDPPPAKCVFDSTNRVTSFHFITQCVEAPDLNWDAAHVDWDFFDPTGRRPAKGNGYVWNSGVFGRRMNYYDIGGIRAMGYYDGGNPNNHSDPGDLNYYYFMASKFATSDRWFDPIMTRTGPNRYYLIAATSQGYTYPVGSNQNDQKPLTATVIFQKLQAAGITWKIYVNPGNTCSGPPYDPNCLLGLSYVNNFVWGQTIPRDYPNNIDVIEDYLTDLKNGTLPQVVQIEPAYNLGLDEHPSDFDKYPINIQLGAKYASSLINALMSSSSWKDSALILTYDEAGGFYDHLPPRKTVSPDGISPVDLEPGDVCTKGKGPICDFVYTGYRVPLIVISPYSKENYVSHTVADYTAILHLIETRFGLSSLNARDAAQMDMTEFFDFNNPAWLTPPTPPAQNTNGACYLNKLP